VLRIKIKMNLRQNKKKKQKYVECEMCNVQIPKNKQNMCGQYQNIYIMPARNRYNNNDRDDRINQLRNQIGDIPNINQGINKRNEEMHRQGYIDNKKMTGSIRILQLNPHGFGPEMNEKINMLKEAIISMEIDVILLSAPDRRWTKSKIEFLRKRLVSIDKNIEIITSDIGQKTKTTTGYLPGGVVSIIKGHNAGLIESSKET